MTNGFIDRKDKFKGLTREAKRGRYATMKDAAERQQKKVEILAKKKATKSPKKKSTKKKR